MFKVLKKKWRNYRHKNKLKLTHELLEQMKHIAITGEGSDVCLEEGFLPVPIHFYQPIPDIKDLEKRKIWDKVSALGGIKFTPDKYLEYYQEISKNYYNECKWSKDRVENSHEFFYDNGSFSYMCAATLHCMIRYNKPSRVIEIGSGFSSKIIKAALAKNIEEGYNATYTVIDPYLKYNKKNAPDFFNAIKKPVEVIDLELFKQLKENDILFIDSSHMCKIGSDVQYEILEILPALNKGVIIHFHDIPMPREYTKVYATNPSFRTFWNESYMLQAFLAFNDSFEILLPLSHLAKIAKDKLNEMFPHKIENRHWCSGSMWIKRVKAPNDND